MFSTVLELLSAIWENRSKMMPASSKLPNVILNNTRNPQGHLRLLKYIKVYGTTISHRLLPSLYSPLCII